MIRALVAAVVLVAPTVALCEVLEMAVSKELGLSGAGRFCSLHP